MKIYKFTRFKGVAAALSLVLIIAFWVGTFLQGGFNFGIDFKAGLNITIEVTGNSDITVIKEALAGIGNFQVQTLGDTQGTFLIRVAEDENIENFRQTIQENIKNLLREALGDGTVSFQNEEYVDARYASSLASQTIILVGVALALILVYIWIRFRLNYAVSAIVAIFHDVLFLIGFIGILQLEFSTATIAAVLTIIGYSLNDTIVIFDRIRENSRTAKDQNFQEIIDQSITQSFSRTIITSLTTLFAVLAIFIFAIGTIKVFALNLIIGVLVGTYSSIFVASPILLVWHNAGVRKVREKIRHEETKHSKPSMASQVLNFTPKENLQQEHVKQTADEITAATLRKAKAKAKKKKKKK